MTKTEIKRFKVAIPTESLDEYSQPERIMHSYQEAKHELSALRHR